MQKDEWIETTDHLPAAGVLVDFMYEDGDSYLTMLSNEVDWKRNYFPPTLWRIALSTEVARAEL